MTAAGSPFSSHPNTASRTIAAFLLMALLVLLTFRLTATETLRENLAAIAARLVPNSMAAAIPFVGPAYTSVYAVLSFVIAAAAAFLAARAQVLSARRSVQFLLIAIIISLALVSVFHAADRFAALVGAADIAASLASAWALAVLCGPRLLGNAGRRAVLAAIVAIGALCCAKALMQYFVEYPETRDYVHEHLDEALRSQGIQDDPVQRTLFLSRLNSNEVSGFGALSNVFATQLIAVIVLLAGIVVAAVSLLAAPDKPPTAGTKKAEKILDHARDKRPAPEGVQIPLHIVAFVLVCILLILALGVVVLTESKGGISCAILGAAVIAMGGFFWKRALAWRRQLLIAAAGAALVGFIAVLGYGLHFDRLPSRSLLFRWHYWTATAPMIEHHSLWGVGLNNFGDYYDQYKRPSSPEDVKDPHGYFVRWLAEAGIPAACFMGGLLLCMILGGFRAPVPDERDPPGKNARLDSAGSAPMGSVLPALMLATLGAALWIVLHLLFAEQANDFNVIMTILYALLGLVAFAASYHLIETLDQRGILGVHYLCVAATVSALAMLLYDQVNMALVTGPVAMLFWMLLALGDSRESRLARGASVGGWFVGALWSAAGAVALIFMAIPVINGTFPWDPAPYETEFVRRLAAGDLTGSLAPLNEALARSPRSMELLSRKVALLARLQLPHEREVRLILELDRANARPRVDMLLADTVPPPLPPRERAAELREALRLDEALPEREPKKLPEDVKEQVRAKIQSLGG